MLKEDYAEKRVRSHKVFQEKGHQATINVIFNKSERKNVCQEIV